MLQSTELEDSKTDPAIGPKLHVGIGTTLKSHSVDAYEGVPSLGLNPTRNFHN